MKNVHLIGIGGSGLSAIARLLVEMGYRVTGSDLVENPIVQNLRSIGVTVYIGHSPEHIRGADVVVRSSAIPEDNVEIQAALKANTPVFKRAEFLGQMMENKTGIAIAGTHGKTTTTAMLAWIFTAIKQEPSFIVGGVLKNLGVNAHAGKGPFFIIEADEYDRMFLGLKPAMEVVTNIEHDHPDCYPTVEDFRRAFLEFARLLPVGGTLIASAEDEGARWLLEEAKAMGKKTVAFSTKGSQTKAAGNGRMAKKIRANNKGGHDFTFEKTHVSLCIPGEHNILNALAALCVVEQLGLPVAEGAAALERFSGTERRFDVRGEVNGIIIVDDYAHHPTEIRATLSAARSRYPERRIWAVWQPHTYSRTQVLLQEFINGFKQADRVIVTEIFAAREQKQSFSAAEVVREMPHPAALFMAELEEASDYLVKHLKPGDVLVVLSAGDADKISAQVMRRLIESEVNHA